jgi:hypothetical protein
MTSAPDPNSGVVPDARSDLKKEFREISERLRAMVDEYDEEPSMIDSGVLIAANNPVNVESAIIRAYKFMNARVYAENSPLRTDGEVWDAFREQRDEFVSFYRSARKALKAFRNVLGTYNGLKDEPVHHGDLEGVKNDEHTLGNERETCIDAVTDFYGKFTAMLSVL